MFLNAWIPFLCVFMANDELFRSPFIQLSSCVLNELFSTDGYYTILLTLGVALCTDAIL